jgi:CRP/FNR family transcriptional regulator, cyclic AMP receptor protein
MRTIDQLIAESPTFAGLAPEHLEFIAGCAWNDRVEAGKLLLREGDPAERFYLIRHGVVALEIDAPGRGPLIIQTLHDGEVLGWSWLFAPHRWAMDGRAVEACSLVTFDGACLRGKCEDDHELGYQLMSRFAANIIDRLQTTRLQLLDVYGRAPASA